MIDISRLDFRTGMFLLTAKPIFAPKHEYTKRIETINPNLIYAFENEEEYKNYFRKYGLDEDYIASMGDNKLVDSSGVVLVYKIYCDTNIKYFKKMQEFKMINTPEKLMKAAMVKTLEKTLKEQD